MDKRLLFEPKAMSELNIWKLKDKNKALRIYDLLKDIQQNPFEGTGKPEPLKYGRQGYWSRRIDRVDRLVYKVTDELIVIISCAHHYENK
jgi:toxin YoeB